MFLFFFFPHCLLLSSSLHLALSSFLFLFLWFSFRAVDRRRLPTRSYYLCFLPTLLLSWFSWDCIWNLQHKRICIYFPHFITLLQFSAIKILLQIQSLILQPTTAHILLLLPPLSLSSSVHKYLSSGGASSLHSFSPHHFSGFVENGSLSISTYDRTREKCMRVLFDLKFNLWFTKERHKCTF